MNIQQALWKKGSGWQGSEQLSDQTQAFFVFGNRSVLEDAKSLNEIRTRFPNAIFIGCSTAGEIQESSVNDDSLAVTALQFTHTQLVARGVAIDNADKSFEIGKNLIQEFPVENLRHLFVLSDGLHVNGSELVSGMRTTLPKDVNITGGLAGDGSDFGQTYVLDAQGNAKSHYVTAVGFYGQKLQVGYGSFGGWDSFGKERTVTKSKANVLYEIDNKPALELYKSFLGEQAKNLPASALLFPLSIKIAEGSPSLTRTILSIDEATQSMTFAGNIPQGSSVRLMKASMDDLIDGAARAASTCQANGNQDTPLLAILISCVGRRLVLKQMVEEEVEAVRDSLGENAVTTGFYSYGEICPFSLEILNCELHNQTMTITCFSED